MSQLRLVNILTGARDFNAKKNGHVHTSKFNIGSIPVDIRRLIFNLERPFFDVCTLIADVARPKINVRRSNFNVGTTTINIRGLKFGVSRLKFSVWILKIRLYQITRSLRLMELNKRYQINSN